MPPAKKLPRPNDSPPRPKVFISSTRDPEQLRHHQVIVGIVESFGWEAITMTRFTSETQNAERGDEAKVSECDLFVLLLGHRYGSCPASRGNVASLLWTETGR